MVSRTSRDSNIAANTEERKAEEDGEENSRVQHATTTVVG